jgi:hypothetical protein
MNRLKFVAILTFLAALVETLSGQTALQPGPRLVNGNIFGGFVGIGGFSSLARCYAAIAPGEMCIVQAGWVDPAWTSNLVMNKNFTGFQFLGSALIPMGPFQLMIADKTVGITIDSPFVFGAVVKGTPPITASSGTVQFVYTGTGAAVLVGTPGAKGERSILLQNIAVNTAGAGNKAIGVDMWGVGNFVANNVSVIAPSGCTDAQIGWRLNVGSISDSEGNHFYNIKAGHSIAFQNNANTIDDFYNVGFTARGCSSYIGFDNEGATSAIHVHGGLISGYGTSIKCNTCFFSIYEVETESGLLSLPDVTLNASSTGNTIVLTGSVSKSSNDLGTNNIVTKPGAGCITGCSGTGKPVLQNSPAVVGLTDTGLSQFKRLKINQGTPQSPANVSLASWGTGSSSTITGFDPEFVVSITAGIGAGSNPKATITFADGSWTIPPVCTTQRIDATAATIDTRLITTPTTLQIFFNGVNGAVFTPVNAVNYQWNVTCIGE